jgi:hypothetical protein
LLTAREQEKLARKEVLKQDISVRILPQFAASQTKEEVVFIICILAQAYEVERRDHYRPPEDCGSDTSFTIEHTRRENSK